MYAGEERGMTSGPMPCWTQYDGTIFDTAEEALHMTKFISTSGYRWKLLPETIEIVRCFGRETKWYDEVTDEEWEKAKTGFRQYMESR